MIDIDRVEKDIQTILTDAKMWVNEKKLWLQAIDIRVKAGYYNRGDIEKKD